jgi:hypothetical protein
LADPLARGGAWGAAALREYSLRLPDELTYEPALLSHSVVKLVTAAASQGGFLCLPQASAALEQCLDVVVPAPNDLIHGPGGKARLRLLLERAGRRALPLLAQCGRARVSERDEILQRRGEERIELLLEPSLGFATVQGRKANCVGELDGVWQVERVGGLLPPLIGVRKRISGRRGETKVGALPGIPFTVEGLTLRYRPPLSWLVDVLEPDADGFGGRATLLGREYGRFLLRRVGETQDV